MFIEIACFAVLILSLSNLLGLLEWASFGPGRKAIAMTAVLLGVILCPALVAAFDVVCGCAIHWLACLIVVRFVPSRPHQPGDNSIHNQRGLTLRRASIRFSIADSLLATTILAIVCGAMAGAREAEWSSWAPIVLLGGLLGLRTGCAIRKRRMQLDDPSGKSIRDQGGIAGSRHWLISGFADCCLAVTILVVVCVPMVESREATCFARAAAVLLAGYLGFATLCAIGKWCGHGWARSSWCRLVARLPALPFVLFLAAASFRESDPSHRRGPGSHRSLGSDGRTLPPQRVLTTILKSVLALGITFPTLLAGIVVWHYRGRMGVSRTSTPALEELLMIANRQPLRDLVEDEGGDAGAVLLEEHKEALSLIRKRICALTRLDSAACAPADIDKYRTLRQCAALLRLAALAYRRAGNTDTALEAYADILRCGVVCGRGGNVTDACIGTAIQSEAVQQLRPLIPSLSSQSCRELAGFVTSINARDEDLNAILLRDLLLFEQPFEWRGVVRACLWRRTIRRPALEPAKWRIIDIVHSTFDTINEARVDRRLLAAELAVAAFAKENGRLPSSVDELVPAYVSEIPAYSFNGETLFSYRDIDTSAVWSSWPTREP